jgi:GNAT superfamily N-acetyltransferase
VILPITELSADELQPLLDESLSDGYRFVQTLLDEYLLGANRFDSPGAALLGVYQQEQMVAIGGVHQDPYLQRADVGRVRHVYVLKEFRRHGVGKLLLDALVEQARSHFTLLNPPHEYASCSRFLRSNRLQQRTPRLKRYTLACALTSAINRRQN